MNHFLDLSKSEQTTKGCEDKFKKLLLTTKGSETAQNEIRVHAVNEVFADAFIASSRNLQEVIKNTKTLTEIINAK